VNQPVQHGRDLTPPADAEILHDVLQASRLFIAEVHARNGHFAVDVPAFVAAAGFDWPGRTYDAVMFWSAIDTRIRWAMADTVDVQFPILLSTEALSVRLVRMAGNRWAVLWHSLQDSFPNGSSAYTGAYPHGHQLASVLADVHGVIAWWNDQFLGLLSSVDGLEGKSLLSILPKDMSSAIKDLLAAAAAGEVIDRLLTTMQPEPRWFRVHANRTTQTDSQEPLVVIQLDEVNSSEPEQRGLVDQLVSDSLTGVYNRRALFDIAALDDPARSPFTVVLLADVRRFKSINDVWGQEAGDRCLVEVASWLRSVAAPGDVVVRLSGDEFLVLCVQGSPVAHEVDSSGELTVPFGDQQIPITLQAGWTERRKGQSLLAAAQRAERALAAAKRSSWRTVVPWTAEISRAANTRVAEEEAVRRAIAAGEVAVHFQPLVNVDGRFVQAVEALVRLSGRGAAVSADRIVDASHELGLMPNLARMVCDRAFREGLQLRSTFPDVHIGINISREFMGTGLAIETVAAAAETAGLDPRDVVLELTEEVAIGVSASLLMSELRRGAELGLSIVIDDFGRGETALSMLRSLPLSGIKLDRSLLPAASDEQGWKFVEGTVSLLRTLAPEIVAEGVESEVQSERLRQLGVVLQQGYLFGAPRPVGYWLKHPPTIPARAVGASG
jgi:diguanylate cyclase (GGDEF)-like protein